MPLSRRAIFECVRVSSLWVTNIQTVNFISTYTFVYVICNKSITYFHFQFQLLVCFYAFILCLNKSDF